MAKYLDRTGLAHLIGKIKGIFLPVSGGTVSGNMTVNGTLALNAGMEIAAPRPFIDFHYGNSTEDYTSRIIESGKGMICLNDTLYVNLATKQVAIGSPSFFESWCVYGSSVITGNIYCGGDIIENGNANYVIASTGVITAKSFEQSSDGRLKRNVRDVRSRDTDKVCGVRLVEYRFRKDRRKRYGVVAQEVEKAGLGSLVSEDGRGMKSVDYIGLLCLKVKMLEERMRKLERALSKG